MKKNYALMRSLGFNKVLAYWLAMPWPFAVTIGIPLFFVGCLLERDL